MYFSPTSGRLLALTGSAYQRGAAKGRNQGFSLWDPTSFHGARTRHSRVWLRAKHIYTHSAELSASVPTNSDGHSRPAEGRGFEDGWFVLIWFISKGEFWVPLLSANTFPPRAFSARPSWSARLPTIRPYGNGCVWRAIIVAKPRRAPSREGIFKGNRRFLLERRLFWYFSLAAERKVHKSKHSLI